MIFVTVGSMMPFDRLIAAMDRWTSETHQEQVFAQIGNGSQPQYMEWVRSVSLAEFSQLVAKSTVIVAHAGMGSIISAAEIGKPIVIVPRFASLKEHTTRPSSTLRRAYLADREYMSLCLKSELSGRISVAMKAIGETHQHLPKTAPEPFIARIRDLLLQGAAQTQ